MKRIVTRILAILISIILCMECIPALAEQSKETNEEKFRFEKTSYSVFAGKTINLKIKTEEKGKATYSYKSADKKIATVSSKGVVKGVNSGTTTITCQITHNNNIYVIETTIKVSIPVKSIKLSSKNLNIPIGTEYKITASVSPSTANKKVKWSSSDTKIATVSADGVVKGLKKGACKITCTAADGSKVKAQINLNVKKYDVVIDSPKGKKVNFDTVSGSYGSRIQIGRYVIQDMVETTVTFKNNRVKGESDNYLIPLKAGEDRVTVTVKENGRQTSKKTYTVYVSQSALFKEDQKTDNTGSNVEKVSETEQSTADDASINSWTMKRFRSGNYQYVLLEDGTAKIIKYAGQNGKLYIPSELDHHKVTIIGVSAFSECKYLRSITIPDNVTSIESFAFNRCSSLTSVTIPYSVKNIEANVFKDCSNFINIIVDRGSYAEDYCISNGIEYSYPENE